MAMAEVAIPAPRTHLSFRNVFLGLAALTAVMSSLRVYQGLFAWETGLDSFHPDFAKYWMSLFYGAVVVGPIVSAAVWGWTTPDHDRRPPPAGLDDPVGNSF